jgi:hypothetical protein
MALRRNRWRTWVLLGLGGLVAWQVATRFGPERARPDNLVNQVWLERWPRDARDMVGHLVAIENDGHRVGSTGRHSRWRVGSDHFVWGQQGDRVRARFPQSGQRVAFQARTWKCAGEAPKQFELCLELKGQAGGKTQSFRFYSRKDWVIRPRGDGQAAEVPEEIAWISPSVQAALAIPHNGTDEADEGVGEGSDTAGLDEVLSGTGKGAE